MQRNVGGGGGGEVLPRAKAGKIEYEIQLSSERVHFSFQFQPWVDLGFFLGGVHH